MANASEMEQEVRNVFKTHLQTDLDIDLSQQCIQAVDASQIMKNIKLKGVKDINFNQRSYVENQCVLNAILNLDIFDELTATVKDQLKSTLEQKGGLSVNVSDTTQKIETIVDTKVGLDARINMAKKCLQDLTANQSIENIQIKDSMNINLTQDSVNYNKCMMESAAALTKGTDIDLEKELEATAETSQAGWDPIASIAGALAFVGMIPSILSAAGCMICSIVIALGMAGGGGGGGEGALEGALGGVEGLGGDGAGISSQASDLFSKFKGMKGGRKDGWLNLLLSKEVLLSVVVVVIGWYIFKNFSTKGRINEGMTSSSYPHNPHGHGPTQHTSRPTSHHSHVHFIPPTLRHTHPHKKKPYPHFDPMYFR